LLSRPSTLPGALSPAKFTLDELRNAKHVHAFLTERVDGPEVVADCVRGFRFLLFFGIASIAENKHPPLTRCWKELERLFMNDPALDDGMFVQSWILMDFPVGPRGETTLDYFEEFLRGIPEGVQFQRFIDAARKSRLGLHQDVMRTKKLAKFRELLSGKVTTMIPSVDNYGKGEILLGRAMAYGDEVFLFGDPKGFPKEAKAQIEEMIRDKLHYVVDLEEELGPVGAAYEKFMKIAGPYWMSCVTKNDATPILMPDHYRMYMDRSGYTPARRGT
jgi:hypothetical protein